MSEYDKYFIRHRWKIGNFPRVLKDRFVEFRSHTFRSLRHKWYMVLSTGKKSGRWVTSIQLFREPSCLDEVKVEVCIGIVRKDGTDLHRCSTTQILTDGQLSTDKFLLARHSDFKLNKKDWISSGVLTIFCDYRINYFESDTEDTEDEESEDEECTDDEEDEEMLDKKCCQSLRQDMLAMFEDGVEPDVTIVNGDLEFQAHQCILSARSRLFHHVLYEDMTKTCKRKVTIISGDNSAFRQYLEFAYTGSVRSLTVDSALSLFHIGDLVQSPDLRALCACHLEENMSTAVICDVLDLESLDEEKDLEDYAYKFFRRHVAEIVEGEAWMAFLKRNPVYAKGILETVNKKIYDPAPMFEIIRQEMSKTVKPDVHLMTQEYRSGNEMSKTVNPDVHLITQEYRSGRRVTTPKESTFITVRKITDADETRLLERECCLRLQRDMLAMFEKLPDPDVTIETRDCEFQAHQCILAGRSRLFHRVLCEDLTEMSTRTVSLKKCESSVFRQFLEFAYTGSVRSMTVDSAVSLYNHAQIFESPDLKAWCSKYLQANMTPTVVCDVLKFRRWDKDDRRLKFKRCDKDDRLFRRATRCLKQHTIEVLEGEGWRKLLKLDPQWASELLKTLKIPNYDKAPMRKIIRQEMKKEIAPEVHLITDEYFGGKQVLHKAMNTVRYVIKNKSNEV